MISLHFCWCFLCACYKLLILHSAISLVYSVSPGLLSWRSIGLFQNLSFLFTSNEMVMWFLYLNLCRVNFTYWFSYVEPFYILEMIMVNEIFTVSSDFICELFIENICIYNHKRNWSAIHFFTNLFFGIGFRAAMMILKEWVNFPVIFIV